MDKDLSCILFPYNDIRRFEDPSGNIFIQNTSYKVIVKICNLNSIVKEAKLEDYSFWLVYHHNNNLDPDETLNYLRDNNIKYSSFIDDREMLITNPDLVLLEEQLQEEDHRIRFTRDTNDFTIYDNDRILLNSVWDELSQYFTDNYIDDTLAPILESSGEYDHSTCFNIKIFKCDIPSFIRWLRIKYTIRTKSANKI